MISRRAKRRMAQRANKSFHTVHNLDFMVAPFEYDKEWLRFKVGTCEGLWRASVRYYDILAIDNHKPGNGHLTDVLQWFEYSCRRDGKSLRVMELWNEGFMQNLINKR